MTKIVTFYSGPGTGKSTSSALLFAWLKMNGHSAELAREYVKKWAWEGRKISGMHEFLFVGKQIDEESRLFDKVDFVVSDKPLLMDIVYSRRYATPTIARGIEAAVRSYLDAVVEAGHQHVHVYLRRSKPYDQRGRYESEDLARAMDLEVLALLRELFIPFEMIATDEDSIKAFGARLVAMPIWGAGPISQACPLPSFEPAQLP